MERDISFFKKYIRIFWTVYAIGVAAIFLMFIMIAQGWLGFMPSFEDLENPESLLASEVVSCDGVVLGKYFKENRSFVNYNEISPNMLNALVATEDVRFYSHSGIDLRGLFRVVKGILTGNTSSGGGSTISQQLAKMLFPRESLDTKLELIFRKFKEWVIAVKLEKSYTKEEILTMYLNKYDFLNLAVGVKSASMIYFNNASPLPLKILNFFRFWSLSNPSPLTVSSGLVMVTNLFDRIIRSRAVRLAYSVLMTAPPLAAMTTLPRASISWLSWMTAFCAAIDVVGVPLWSKRVTLTPSSR